MSVDNDTLDKFVILVAMVIILAGQYGLPIYQNTPIEKMVGKCGLPS